MEIRKGNEAVQKVANMVFYGKYYFDGLKEGFQVFEAKEYTERKFNNLVKKYGLDK